MDNTFPGSEPVPPHHSHTVRLENDVQGAFTYPEYPFFSTDLIVESFKKFKNSKSPGPDKFKPRMLKHLPPIALDRLRQLYEASYYSGYVPQNWLMANVVFLSKPGKASYSLPSSFRPICLTSFVFKNMERLVYWNLLETSLQDNPLHDRQHGFRRGLSTDTALSMMMGRIEKALRTKRGMASLT